MVGDEYVTPIDPGKTEPAKKTDTSGSGSGQSDNTSKSDSSKSKYSNEWVDGKWYNQDGTQTYTGTISWRHNSKGWWAEDTKGWYPAKTWQKINGVWYYFDEEGYMAANEWIDGYWLDKDGVWRYKYVGSWRLNSKGWWFEDTNKWYAYSGWQKINGKYYYFGDDGYMYKNRYIGEFWVGDDGAYVESE